jgi:hypothetical protein
MAKSVRVTNQTKNDILTITGGWLRSHDLAVVEDWEADILSELYGKDKVFVTEQVEEKPTKKTKK